MTVSSGRIASELLAVISLRLEELSDSEVELFIADLRSWTPKRRNQKKERPRLAKSAKHDSYTEYFEPILKAISSAESREAVIRNISEHKLSRSRLVQLSKLLNVHVTKNDTIEKIYEKIGESTVGSRLRSTAVRGS